MTRSQALVLISRIKAEMENIERLQGELASKGFLPSSSQYQGKFPFPFEDSFTLRAIGSVLHDIYVAMENIFEMVARELDESLPTDPSWHLTLLRQMTLDLPEIRPRVISLETAQMLDALRSFRHVFRNVYGFNLDSKRLQLLLEALPQTLHYFRRDLESFMEKLAATLK